MKILVVNADCVTVNSSANLCHLAYLHGLRACGHEVTLLSADGRDYRQDPAMTIPDGVSSVTYYGVSLYERLSMRRKSSAAQGTAAASAAAVPSPRGGIRGLLRSGVLAAKRFSLSLYGIHGIYSTFARKALAFRSDTEFDYMLSLSTPAASHLLAYRLLHTGRVRAKHWIQIWEDPWHSDVYGFNGADRIRAEEQRLLSFAEKVCYVSPLTLKYQQEKYPESAHKMFWQPLPVYYQAEATGKAARDRSRYGYFGDYTPASRNLEPFYEAAKETGIEVNICGNPSDLFPSTEHIHIHPRLPLDKLKPIEDSTNVLIFLCNRQGGQIPGKIYQYSATDKTVLFIMDGTAEEQQVLGEFFGKFDRFVFCRNSAEDIARAIRQIESGDLGTVKNVPLADFDPAVTIENILRAGS